MPTGYDDFLETLKNFRSLSSTALGAGAMVPFVAYVANISPPWPPGIMLITALIELVTIIMVFQLTRPLGRAVINRVLIYNCVFLFMASLVYLILFSWLTFVTPKTGQRWVAGFYCLNETRLVYGECLFLPYNALPDAQYEAAKLWTGWSIAISKISLVATWLLSFVFLSALISTFIVFQMKTKSRRLAGEVTR